MKSFFLVTVIITILSTTIFSQSEGEINSESQSLLKKNALQTKQQRKRYEKKLKSDINLSENIEQYNFIAEFHSEFILRIQTNQKIKGTVDIYWKEHNVYLLSQVQEGQQFEIVILQNDQSIIFKNQFYTTTGFEFDAKENKYYRIVFQSQGEIPKLVILKMARDTSNALTKSEVAKKSHLQASNTTIKHIFSKLENNVSPAQLNHLLSQKAAEAMLANTRHYKHYQIFQIVLIVLSAFLELTFLNKLLTRNSIV